MSFRRHCRFAILIGLSAFAFSAQAADFIIDNSDPEAQVISGSWWNLTGGTGYEGANYITTGNSSGGEFRWTPNLAGAEAEYDVYVKYSADWWWLGTDAPYTVSHDGGNDLILVDQTQNGGQWVLLGRFALTQGSYVSIGDQLSNNRRPSTDSVRFVTAGPLPPPPPAAAECGDPRVSGQDDFGIFVWKDCDYAGPEARWNITASGGGANWSGNAGTIFSDNIIGATGSLLEADDTLDSTTGDTEVDFIMFAPGADVDSFRTDIPANSSACFVLGFYSSGPTYFLGADRQPISGNLDMQTLEACDPADLDPDPNPNPEEIIIDNTDPEAQVISGDWWTLSGGNGYEGSNFTTSDSSSGGEFRWTPDLAGAAGEFDVYVKYASDWWNLGTDAPYTIVHDRGSEVQIIDQTQNGGQWVLLGRYSMSLGSYVSIEAALGNNKRPSADAIRLVRRGEPAERRLNFVVIITDDQRWDSVDEMPMLLNKIADRGVRFENAFVSTPVCGAVRPNILTGGFRSYNTGIIMNPGVNGGEVKFRGQDSDTIATALQQVGYKTMFAGGKYINGYKQPYIPPGWTRFVNNKLGPCCSGWFNFEAIVGSSDSASSTGTTEVVSQYINDYHKDKVLEFLDDYNGSDFLVFFSTFGPHAPAIPDGPDVNLFQNFVYNDRAVNETDLSDKPNWVANPNRYLSIKVPELPDMPGRQLRSLQSIDRSIGEIVDKIEAMGELDRTVFIFTSDNGYLWGEHGLHTKGMAYDESIRVPFIVAAPGVAPGSVNSNLITADLDIGATIYDMVGLDKPSDGESIASILTNPSAPFRSAAFFQHWGFQEGAFGTWSAMRTDQFKYIENAYGEEELYDLATDPFEEDSLHNDPNFAVLKSQMAQTLSENRGLSLRTFNLGPNGRVGTGYNFQLETWGGQLPFKWYITTGSLPDGLSLNPSTGRISGTPTAAGTFYAEIAVEDSSVARHSWMPQRMVGNYTITISP